MGAQQTPLGDQPVANRAVRSSRPTPPSIRPGVPRLDDLLAVGRVLFQPRPRGG
jgi:hypothetical protein